MTGVNYDVIDYIDILKNQMSEKDYKNTKRSLLVSSTYSLSSSLEKHRNFKGLMDLYGDVILSPARNP